MSRKQARTRDDDWPRRNKSTQRRAGQRRLIIIAVGGAVVLAVAATIVYFAYFHNKKPGSSGGNDAPAIGGLQSRIVGKWQGSKGIMEIKADGTVNFGGNVTGNYILTGDILQFGGREGLKHRVEIDGDVMTLTRAEEEIPLELREKSKRVWKRVK